MSKPRSFKQTDAGRIPKKIEFEPPIYRKAEALIKQDKKKPTLKTKLSELIEAEHDRRFGHGRAA
jgi:hypothetical protein